MDSYSMSCVLDKIDWLIISIFKLIYFCNQIISDTLFVIVWLVNEYIFPIDLCIAIFWKYQVVIVNMIRIFVAAICLCRALYVTNVNDFTITNIFAIYVSIASFFLLWYLHMESDLQ